MDRHEVQREVREAIVTSDRLSRLAHASEEHTAAGNAAGVRSTLENLERQLGRRGVSPLFARKLDRVLERLVKVCESMGPEHQAQAAPLLSQAQLLRLEVQEASLLLSSPGESTSHEWITVGALLAGGVALLALSFPAFARD